MGFVFVFDPASSLVRFLVPLAGIKPSPLAVKAQSPNHWTTREFQAWVILKIISCYRIHFLKIK